MKYIRTKDSIYEIVNDYGSSCAVKSRGKRGRIAIDGFTIKYGLYYAPRADTIEELCDEYVVEDNYYSAIFNNLKLARQTKGTCYGAIRTEWGLKYVAKINKEGKWELL